MNYIDYSNQRTKAGELMNTEKPLIDYVNHSRRTDRKPERQDGAGAILWIVVMFLCNVLLALIGVHYG